MTGSTPGKMIGRDRNGHSGGCPYVKRVRKAADADCLPRSATGRRSHNLNQYYATRKLCYGNSFFEMCPPRTAPPVNNLRFKGVAGFPRWHDSSVTNLPALGSRLFAAMQLYGNRGVTVFPQAIPQARFGPVIFA